MAAPLPAHIREGARLKRLIRAAERAEGKADQIDARVREHILALERRVATLEAEVAALKAVAPTTPRR